MKPIVIIGAGLAGLTCAEYLRRAGKQFLVLDRSDSVGGRVRSDIVDGFILDRGFQVFLDSYPEARACLDYEALRFGKFDLGALVWSDRGFVRIADALRAPTQMLATLRSGAFTIGDMVRVLALRNETQALTKSSAASVHNETTHEFLKARSFSDRSIDRFFKPFFSGVFLEEQLSTPADMFAFVFRMFATGTACLPSEGMGAIPRQLAERLPQDSIRLNTEVKALTENGVVLVDGDAINAEAIVIATEIGVAARLLSLKIVEPSWRSTTTLYFSAKKPPVRDPILVLDGTAKGIVNSVVVPTNVCPSYSTRSESLITVSLVGSYDDDLTQLETRVREELQSWFGDEVLDWDFLTSYHIPWALPADFGSGLAERFNEAARSKGVELAGDFVVNPSINGAMASGRAAAERLVAREVTL